LIKWEYGGIVKHVNPFVTDSNPAWADLKWQSLIFGPPKSYVKFNKNCYTSGCAGKKEMKQRIHNLNLNEDHYRLVLTLQNWCPKYETQNKKMGKNIFFTHVYTEYSKMYIRIVFCSRTFQTTCWIWQFLKQVTQSST
jgi:hypothetical protein